MRFGVSKIEHGTIRHRTIFSCRPRHLGMGKGFVWLEWIRVREQFYSRIWTDGPALLFPYWRRRDITPYGFAWRKPDVGTIAVGGVVVEV